MKVSLILTVLNEGEHVRRLFDSILRQTRRPDEIVVCDGGSRDDTVAVIESYASQLPITVVHAPGANISQGRNAAIRAARGEVIAATDAGVWLEDRWLEELLRAGGWEGGDGRGTAGGSPAVAAGFYQSDPGTVFEIALGATTLPGVGEIDPAKFLPSSRSVAFLKSAWEAAGGYPEWLDYSEDVVFDLKMRETFGAFAFAPKAVAHFRPRPTLRAFAKQYFNYARGDGRANLWPHIHLIRYFTYVVAVPLGLYAALTVSPWLWLVGALAGLAYVRRPLQRLLFGPAWAGQAKAGQTHRSAPTAPTVLAAMLWVPVIRVTGDVAKMLGYPAGILERLRSGRSTG